MAGGLLRGLYHEAAARFSFLIASPMGFGSAVPEIPKPLHQDVGDITEPAITSGALADVIAFLGASPDAAFQVTRFPDAKSFRLLLLGLRTRSTGSAGLCGVIAPLPPTRSYFALIREEARF